MIDIQEVGTGGGSIAEVELGGGLCRRGWHSAARCPGPGVLWNAAEHRRPCSRCEISTSSGRLGVDRFLGGEMRLDRAAAERAIDEHVARPLGLSVTAAAEGILRIATTKMAHVVRWVTTERGLDAADFTLVAYGGAGPLHAVMVARELGISRVVISAPRREHFSALGMLASDLRRDFVLDLVHPGWPPPPSTPEMEAMFSDMERQGRDGVARGSVSGEAATTARGADMRYVGQEHAVTVALPAELFAAEDRAGIKRAFDAVHEVRYGFSSPQEPAEIVSLRSSVTG